MGGFREARGGVDVTHGMMDLFEHLLRQLPPTPQDAAEPQHAAPYPVEETDIYLKSLAGRGAEVVECSEAFRQLFMSTEEVVATVEKDHVTAVSCLAHVFSAEGLQSMYDAMAVVLFQKGGPSEVEIPHLECRTRLGLQVACRCLVSFRIHANRESTLMFVLTVKQEGECGSAALAPPSRGHPGRPTTRLVGAEEEKQQQPEQLGQEQEQKAPRRSHATTRLTSRKQEHERREAAVSASGASASSSSASSAPLSDPRPPATAKRGPAPSRPREPAQVSWSAEGPPVLEAMYQRLITRSPHLASVRGGAWCRDAATGAIVWRGAGEPSEGPGAAGACPVAQDAAVTRLLGRPSAFAPQPEQAEAQDGQPIAPFVSFEEPGAVAVAGGGKQPHVFPAAVAPASAAGAPVLWSSSSGSTTSRSNSSTSSSVAAVSEDVSVNDDEVWAWADSLLEGGSGADGDGGCALVTEPEVWMLLERPPLFDSMGLL